MATQHRLTEQKQSERQLNDLHLPGKIGVAGCLGSFILLGFSILIVIGSSQATPTPRVSLANTSTIVPAPDDIIIATPLQGDRIAPEQAVKEYFELVIQRRYDVTFSRLTDNLKQNRLGCNGSNWYDCPVYFNWANSLTAVKIYDIRPVDPSESSVNYARLIADIEFVGDFGVDRYQHYQVILVWNSMCEQWMIDQTVLE